MCTTSQPAPKSPRRRGKAKPLSEKMAEALDRNIHEILKDGHKIVVGKNQDGSPMIETVHPSAAFLNAARLRLRDIDAGRRVYRPEFDSIEAEAERRGKRYTPHQDPLVKLTDNEQSGEET